MNPKTGKQEPHGKGKCTGKDADVPQDVVDAARDAFKLTGNELVDLYILEFSERFSDTMQGIHDYIPGPAFLPIPGFIPWRVPIPVVP